MDTKRINSHRGAVRVGRYPPRLSPAACLSANRAACSGTPEPRPVGRRHRPAFPGRSPHRRQGVALVRGSVPLSVGLTEHSASSSLRSWRLLSFSDHHPSTPGPVAAVSRCTAPRQRCIRGVPPVRWLWKGLARSRPSSGGRRAAVCGGRPRRLGRRTRTRMRQAPRDAAIRCRGRF